MTETTTPEIAALETFLQNLLDYRPGNHPMAAGFDSCWPSTAPNRLLEFMQVLGSLEGLIATLPNNGMRITASKAASDLTRIFNAEDFAGTIDAFRNRNAKELYFARGTLSLLHDLKVDRDKFFELHADFEAAISTLADRFGASDLSDASKSVLMAQLQLLKNSVSRFNEGAVGPFRDSAFSIVGRVIIQIRTDTSLGQNDKRQLIDDVLRVYDVIDKGGTILSLVGHTTLLLLSGPKAS